MALRDDRVCKQVRSAFTDLARLARLVMFTQGEGGALACECCGDTRERD